MRYNIIQLNLKNLHSYWVTIIMDHSSTLSLKVKLAVAVTVFLWASAFVAIRSGLEGFSPGPLAYFRFLIAAICMTIIYFNLPTRNKISITDKLLMLIIGAITLGIYHITLNYGEMTISAGLASFVVSQAPIITTLFAILFLRERLNKMGIVGLAISTLGMILILLAQDNNMQVNIGILYALAAAIAGSAFNVLQKLFLKKYSAIEVTTYGIWGSLITFSYYLPAFSHEIFNASFKAILSALYLGIFPAAIATMTWTYTLSAMPASRASNFIYFMPIIATVLGWLCLGEAPLLLSFLGGMLALAGVWVVNKSYYKAALIQQRSIRKFDSI
jgi:drug/metabolite transporter (DMT)-like permease